MPSTHNAGAHLQARAAEAAGRPPFRCGVHGTSLRGRQAQVPATSVPNQRKLHQVRASGYEGVHRAAFMSGCRVVRWRQGASLQGCHHCTALVHLASLSIHAALQSIVDKPYQVSIALETDAEFYNLFKSGAAATDCEKEKVGSQLHGVQRAWQRWMMPDVRMMLRRSGGACISCRKPGWNVRLVGPTP